MLRKRKSLPLYILGWEYIQAGFVLEFLFFQLFGATILYCHIQNTFSAPFFLLIRFSRICKQDKQIQRALSYMVRTWPLLPDASSPLRDRALTCPPGIDCVSGIYVHHLGPLTFFFSYFDQFQAFTKVARIKQTPINPPLRSTNYKHLPYLLSLSIHLYIYTHYHLCSAPYLTAFQRACNKTTLISNNQ